ncbi:MAG: hypothetical protein ABL998_16335 [Planctomycetota bacterium]
MIRTVHFLELDNMDDYVVSFWLDETGTRRVTVQRLLEFSPELPEDHRPTPELYTHERAQPPVDRLVAAEWNQTRVYLKSEHREFTLDVSRIEACNIQLAREILRRMNWDDSFDLMLRRGPKKPKPGAKAEKSP